MASNEDRFNRTMALDAIEIQQRLEYLRSQIEAESISYSEISELQGLAEYIDTADAQLLEWAGVPEQPEYSNPNYRPEQWP